MPRDVVDVAASDVMPYDASDNANYASDFMKRLMKMVQEFEDELDEEHEVGMSLVSFGSSKTFHVTQMEYNDPNLIVFHGKLEDGAEVQLIQHVSQINFLLMATRRQNPQKPKKQIGFAMNKESINPSKTLN